MNYRQSYHRVLNEKEIKINQVETERQHMLDMFNKRKETLKKNGIDWWNDSDATKLCGQCHNLYAQLLMLVR